MSKNLELVTFSAVTDLIESVSVLDLLTLGFIAATASWLLVGGVLRYALRRGVLDRPTTRGSHSVPTPRGGGIGVVVACLFTFFIAAPAVDWRLGMAFGAVLPTAIVGWIDDHRTLPVIPRVAAHLLSGFLLLPLALAPDTNPLILPLLAAGWLVATVSAINVVNFVDGIDGLVGLQALVFAIHGALLTPAGSSSSILALALAGASFGFLIWNWPPARVFLGDVGSGSLAVLGVVIGVLAWRAGRVPFVAVFLPLFPIFLDAAITIVRRVRRRERLTEAHRSHLYQRLANEASWGHARVSLLYGAAAGTAVAVVQVAPPAALVTWSIVYMVGIVSLGVFLDRHVRDGLPDRESKQNADARR